MKPFFVTLYRIVNCWTCFFFFLPCASPFAGGVGAGFGGGFGKKFGHKRQLPCLQTPDGLGKGWDQGFA